MKTKCTLLLLLTFAFGFSQKKANPLQIIDSTTINADNFIGYDKYDFLYFIKNNTLHKQKNNQSLEYKNIRLGNITKVDLLNPLKIIVFYEKFNTAITLDNQLNETLKVNFSELKNPLVVSKIGIASQNQWWVFDEISQQLYLYDTTNANLKPVATPISETITHYNTNFNYFEWLDKSNNRYQCSIFGTVTQDKLNADFDTLFFSDTDLIIYKKDLKLFAFNKKTNQTTLLKFIDKTFINLTYKNQILSIFTNQGISNYKITIP